MSFIMVLFLTISSQCICKITEIHRFFNFFSRESNSTNTNVRPSVCLSVRHKSKPPNSLNLSSFIILHHPSSFFIILHHPSSSFIILHHHSSSFIILHHLSSSFINLHQPSSSILPFTTFKLFSLFLKTKKL